MASTSAVTATRSIAALGQWAPTFAGTVPEAAAGIDPSRGAITDTWGADRGTGLPPIGLVREAHRPR